MGRILYVEEGAADEVSFGYVIQSRADEPDADTYYVSVPVARERDFKRNRFHIVVPPGEGRVSLRVYELSGQADAKVDVTLRALMFGWTAVGRRGGGGGEMGLTNREGSDPSYPFFGEMLLDLSCFVTSPRNCSEWVAAVEIEPLVEGEYWAVVSRTHNTTQQVTLYWPQ